jgi:hypothetical protein
MAGPGRPKKNAVEETVVQPDAVEAVENIAAHTVQMYHETEKPRKFHKGDPIPDGWNHDNAKHWKHDSEGIWEKR